MPGRYVLAATAAVAAAAVCYALLLPTIAPTSPPATCAATSLGTIDPTPAGVNTTTLGAQPAGYELWAPAGGRVRGVMIGIHGGGWENVGPPALSTLHDQARQWVGRGFAFVNLDYRACGNSLADVERLHDALRARLPDVPFFVTGESAGAHLALLLAADRPDSILRVIANAPPANADLLAKSNPSLAEVWHDAFGEEWNTTFNPYARAGDIRAKVLLAVSSTDPITAPEQATSLEGGTRDAPILDGGSQRYFPHADITAAAHELYESRVEALLAPYRAASYTVPWAPAAP